MDNIYNLLVQYRYLTLFPLAIVEGPIVAVIAGFLCTGGLLNLLIVYPIILAGDMIGDSLVYVFGRWGAPPFLKRMFKGLGVNSSKIYQVRSYFDLNPNKTISLSKITLGIGFAGLYIAGNAKVPYLRYIIICLITSALQYIVYLGIGLIFGAAYIQISHYLDFFSALIIVLVLAIILVCLIKSRTKKL
jgi:membrane protein DedA with SNARE-associated domain